MSLRGDRLGPALLVALLIATLIAGAFVYRARTPDLALEVLSLVEGECLDQGATKEVEFFVRFDEPHATVQIVAAGQVPVRTLAADAALTKDQRVTYEWDGLDDDGEPVNRGRYRVRVVLPLQDRDMVYPTKLTVTPSQGPRAGQCDPPEATA